jgi:hypothetical protein
MFVVVIARVPESEELEACLLLSSRCSQPQRYSHPELMLLRQTVPMMFMDNMIYRRSSGDFSPVQTTPSSPPALAMTDGDKALV